MGVRLPSPHTVKTQLSSDPGNGEAMARKRAEAPKKMKKMMEKTAEAEGLAHV